MANKNAVVLNYRESLLRISDVELLSGPFWLNDTLISFFFDYLEDFKFKSDTNLLFVPPQVTQCIKIVESNEIGTFLDPLESRSKDFIFFALNDNKQTEVCGGSHWSLLVFSYPERKCFHFDSSRGSNHDQAVEMGRKVLKFQKINTLEGVVESRCLQQNNGYDCGIHMLAQCELVAEYVRDYKQVEGCPLLARQVVTTKRRDILNLIDCLRRNSDHLIY